MTATELKKRAIALAEKTKIDSVTPEEVGQLSNDIVEYIENVEINGSSLGIRKTYTSVSAMEADSTAPKDDKGVLLRRGMLVNIYNQEDPDSADNGKVFSFQNPGWAFRGTIDAGYATKEELTELDNEILTYNVSINNPTEGIDGTNQYTLEKALEVVPLGKRKTGLNLSFLDITNTLYVYEYAGLPWISNRFSLVGTRRFLDFEKSQNVYNVDYHYPLEEGFYTLSTARNTVPANIRKKGLIITFKISETTFANEQYIDDNLIHWGDDNYWISVGIDACYKYIIAWNGNVNNTRTSIPVRYRKQGMLITYNNPEQGWIIEQFIGDITTGSDWTNNDNWKSVSDANSGKEDLSLVDDASTDFSISDEQGNEVCRFKNGHIQTKNFNSEEAGGSEVGNINVGSADFELKDENDNTILKLKDGHIQTQKFNSKDLVGGIVFDELYYFTVPVNSKNPFKYKELGLITTSEAADTEEIYNDHCILRLPQGHSGLNKPIKLVVYFHGSGEAVFPNPQLPPYTTSGIVEYRNQIPTNLFLACGYALLAVNGLPYDYAKKYIEPVLPEEENFNLAYGRPVGNWMAIDSANKAVEYVCKNYNIDKNEIYVYGESQGGMTALNFIELGGYKIKAAVLDSPALSMLYHQCQIGASVPYVMNVLYGTEPNSFDKTKVVGLDPYTRNCSKVEVKEDYTITNDKYLTTEELEKVTSFRFAKCPIKFFLGAADASTKAYASQIYVKQLKNGGQFTECNLYDGIKHCTDQNSPKIGNFMYNEEIVPLSQPEVDMVLWFSRFGGNDMVDII